MIVYEYVYTLILRDAGGLAVPGKTVERFPDRLEVGQSVTYDGAEWVVERIDDAVRPPLVSLARRVAA